MIWNRSAAPAVIALAFLSAACGHGSSEPSPDVPVGALRVGVNTTCASVEDPGTAYCWGANEFGQVGDGTTADRSRPTAVVGAPRFTAAYPGDHACVVDAAELLCWGRNLSGELGRGTLVPGPTPGAVLGDLAFQQIAIGDDFSCGIAGSGATYCWGANDVGQLGTGVPGTSSEPALVAGDLQFGSIVAGGKTACGIAIDQLYCWGNGADGELGTGAFDVSASVPTAVAGGLHVLIVAIGADVGGRATVCALAQEGPYCWGKNTNGEVGDGTTVGRSVPTAVLGLDANVQLAPGGSHTCARVSSAEVVCWGKGGRLGTGSAAPSLSPVPVAGGHVFAAIYAGRDHTCGRTDDDPSTAWCWGENARGQLGDGTTTRRLSPGRVAFPP